MIAKVFVDTNIFLYTLDEDPASVQKRDRARELLLTTQWAWSVQVAAEFYVNATSPKRPFRLSHADAEKCVHTWLLFPTVALTSDILKTALQMRDRFNLSYWDAAILAAAKSVGCHTVYSEDLSHTQTYDSLTVINPFVPSPPS